MVMRGVQVVTAMTVLFEMGDLRRFDKAKEFMAALGLVPSEYSSGGKTSRGSITKTGNTHVRRVLVESAWHYRHRPTVGKTIKARRTGKSLELLNIAQKADVRLYKKIRRMTDRGKRSTVAVVAAARELAGFIWAIGQQVHLKQTV
jgi:transposase